MGQCFSRDEQRHSPRYHEDMYLWAHGLRKTLSDCSSCPIAQSIMSFWDVFELDGISAKDVATAETESFPEPPLAQPTPIPPVVSGPCVIGERPHELRPRSPPAQHKQRHIGVFGTWSKAVAACNYCKWIKHKNKWSAKCSFTTLTGQTQSWLEENPEPLAPFSLYCKLCAAFIAECPCEHGSTSSFVRKEVGLQMECSKSSLQLEDLLRHGNNSAMQKFGKVRPCTLHARAVEWARKTSTERVCVDSVQDEPRDDVITAAQARIAYDIAKNCTSPQTLQYVRDCKLARRSGDILNVKSGRISEKQGPRIIECVAAALFAQDVKLLKAKRDPVDMIGHSKDIVECTNVLTTRYVTRNFYVYPRLLDVHDNDGSKYAVAKATRLLMSIQDFANGDDDVEREMLDKSRAMTTDAEPAEQACSKVAKETSFRNLDVMLCCNLHGGQNALEHSLLEDERCRTLITELVTKLKAYLT